MKEASYINIHAKEGKQQELVQFLSTGAQLVAKTEPLTLLWAALQNEDEMVIFDTFADDAGRKAHFKGQVASLVKQNAENLIKDGWDNGVVSNIKNPRILSSKTSDNPDEMNISVITIVHAKTQREADFAKILSDGAEVIKATEPKTAFWYGMQFTDNQFGVIDFFADQSGVEAHLNGKVAGLIHEKAQDLLVSGWDDGVLAKTKQYKVLAINLNK